MPQLVKKRRSGWAVLAAAAMVASILAVGASPAAAIKREPNQQSTWRACLGEATAGADFTDVSDTSSHAMNINCLAYYEITTGKTDDTFDPNGSVTRSQMALFLARAADAAGIDLGDAMDMGFTDIGDADNERRNAINRLTAKGIMFGDTATSFDPPSTTTFAPTDYVTRWEMAMFLFAFLDQALDSVLVDQVPKVLDGDGVGHIELNAVDGEGSPVDDYFRDATRETPAHIDERISAIYELGVTKGTNGQIGEDGLFDPNGNVTRAQMASFIMRALNHTNLRPKGVSAQQTDEETQVSVRNADFEPVPDVRVEVFDTADPEDAFDDDGECVGRYTDGLDGRSDRECRIETGDEQTDGDGNAVYPVGSATSNQTVIECANTDDGDGETDDTLLVGTYTLMTGPGSSDYTAWAWTGDIGDEVDDDTPLSEVESANVLTRRSEAVKAVVSGGAAAFVKMGRSVSYTVQLVDGMGNPVGPTPGASHGVLVTTTKNAQTDVDSETFPEETYRDTNVLYEPDSNGTITIPPIGNPDPQPYGSNNDPDVQLAVTITTATGNTLPLADMTMGTVTTLNAQGQTTTTEADIVSYRVAAGLERFSDNDSVATKISTSPDSAWMLLGPGSGHTLTLRVTDQYGDAFTDTDYRLQIDPSSTVDDTTTDIDENVVSGLLYNSGRRSLSYDYGGTGPSAETVAVAGDPDADGTGGLPGDGATVYWANIGVNFNDGADIAVLLVDESGYILVDDPGDDNNDAYPVALLYGDDDRFVVEGVVLTYDQFQEVVGSPQISLSEAVLSWEGFNYNRRNDYATWRLDGLRCSPAAGSGD